MAGYGHPGIFDEDADEKLDKVVSKATKGSKLSKFMDKGDKEQMKYQVFDSAVMDAVYAARDMYCNGDVDLDQAMSLLSEQFKKLKGKEEELMKVCKEDEEEDEEDDDDEKEDKAVLED